MSIYFGGQEYSKMYLGGAEVSKGIFAGQEFHGRVIPVSFFDASVVPGDGDPNVQNATAGCDWAFTRTVADSNLRDGVAVLVDSSLTASGFRPSQRLPPGLTDVSGGNSAWVTYVTLIGSPFGTTSRGITFRMFAGTSAPTDRGSGSGPNLTEAVEDSRGIAVRAANGAIAKWSIADLDNIDESEPYFWRMSMSSALITALEAANAQIVIVDRTNANVDWDNLMFRSA